MLTLFKLSGATTGDLSLPQGDRSPIALGSPICNRLFRKKIAKEGGFGKFIDCLGARLAKRADLGNLSDWSRDLSENLPLPKCGT